MSWRDAAAGTVNTRQTDGWMERNRNKSGRQRSKARWMEVWRTETKGGKQERRVKRRH